jgi:HSP20 family protein
MIRSMMKRSDQRDAAPASPDRSTDDSALPTYIPKCDIRESDGALEIVADIPGVDESSVDITIDQGVLTIRGTVKPETHDGFTLVHREYGVGNYERSFTLGEAVAADEVTATVRHGVLRLTLPKARSAQPRRIAVKAG